jgi:hypothetical protein
MTTPTPLADLTTCKHCGQSFTGPRIEIIGQPEARLQAYLQMLSKHFYEKHPQQAQMMDIHTAIYSGLLFLMNFKTTDKELNEKRDHLRWTIHQQTLKGRVSDESLHRRAKELAYVIVVEAFTPMQNGDSEAARTKVAESLMLAFTGIRDALEEPGKYPEAQTQQKLVVV